MIYSPPVEISAKYRLIKGFQASGYSLVMIRYRKLSI
uniref:Uncharacterized protein n=1 Tax=uncultured Desulfobacterium sp. TaxID=201089 RepID=E1YKQ1_9BACT|nr:unknown protein [uncultured Desulfobacterium sp.]